MQVSMSHAEILSALQKRSGSRQKGLRINEINKLPVVIGTVPSYHALQEVIRDFGDSVGYNVKVLNHRSHFVMNPQMVKVQSENMAVDPKTNEEILEEHKAA